jgi:hypothetical protein
MPERLRGLALADYSDRELLLALIDHADADGWTDARALARSLGIENDHPTRCVGARMAWLRRYGVAEKDPDRIGYWQPTAIGAALARGKLTTAEAQRLEQMAPEKLLLVTRLAAGRVRTGPDPMAHMLRREWRRGAILGRD